MTQEERFANRLKKLLEETGLHEIRFFVSPDKEIVFWIVKSEKTEGAEKALPQNKEL